MSRIGKKPIALPSGVDVVITDNDVTVKGAKGTLSVPLSDAVRVRHEDATLVVALTRDDNQARALWGLMRALIANAIIGVSEGITKQLEIRGVGYRAQIQGNVLECALGYSHTIRYPFPEGITLACPRPTEIIVSGIDKQKVGQVAAEIRAMRSPEPYKGKGVRYLGEYVPLKEGKNK